MGDFEESDGTEPPPKRLRLSSPSAVSWPPLESSPHMETVALSGSSAYRAAKETLRRKGGLFERWSRGDAKWESFDLSLLAGSDKMAGSDKRKEETELKG
jgi:hypothetical protein